MKITMIGSTSTGKTCYMLGMYAFMSMGLRGFTLTASNPDVDLELMKKWDNLVDKQSWPFGNNTVIDRYLFDFNYGGKQIGGFEWADYRGGALEDKSTEKEVSELWDVFQSSSCLFICVSGEFLQESIFDKDEKGNNITLNNSRKNKIARKLNCNRLNIIIKDIKKKINSSNDNPFPVVILITKFDCCANRSQDEISLDIKELFNFIFVSNSGFLTMICPVSLGKELIKGESKDGKPTFTGEIDPINVHVPVAFAIYSQLYKQASAKVTSQSTIQDKITKTTENLGKDNNWWNRTFNQGKITGHTDSLQTSQKQLQTSQEELQKIVLNMQLLRDEIKNFPIFIGDSEADV